jgi:hypothetical protein
MHAVSGQLLAPPGFAVAAGPAASARVQQRFASGSLLTRSSRKGISDASRAKAQ